MPVTFTQARLADVHALYWINKAEHICRGYHGLWNFEVWRALNEMLVWMPLTQRLPSLVGPAASPFAVRDGRYLRYTEVLAIANRHLAITVAALVAVVGTLAVVWPRVLRVH